MKPLNHKERSDRYLLFFISLTITLVLTVLLLYGSNNLLLQTRLENDRDRQTRYLQYKQNQQRYTELLKDIRNAIEKGSQDEIDQKLKDWKDLLKQSNDTSALRKKVVPITNDISGFFIELNIKNSDVRQKSKDLSECKKALKELQKID